MTLLLDGHEVLLWASTRVPQLRQALLRGRSFRLAEAAWPRGRSHRGRGCRYRLLLQRRLPYIGHLLVCVYYLGALQLLSLPCHHAERGKRVDASQLSRLLTLFVAWGC